MFARNVFGILKENEGKVAILGIKDLERVSPKSHRIWKYWYNGFNK